MYRDFVRSAHDAGGGAAAFGAVHRKLEAGEVYEVRLFKAQIPELPEVEVLKQRGAALRIRQRKLDRKPHVRYAELGDHGAVHQLHHRVYDALGVNHHSNVLRLDGKEVHGLHKLQPLVHQRGAVHGNLRAHAPVGMRHRLRGRNALQLLALLPAEGAAGAGEQDLVQLAFSPAHETLEDGGMLRIHGHDLRALLLCPRHDEIARADKRLLVGKGDALFRVDGGKRRPEPHRAGDRRHHAVALPERRGLDQSLHAGTHADVRIGHGDFELLCRVFVIDRDEGGLELSRLLLQQVDFPVRSQCRDTDAGMLGHRGGLPPDGAGAAENGNALDHISILCLSL